VLRSQYHFNAPARLRREVLMAQLAEQLQVREVGGGLFVEINDHIHSFRIIAEFNYSL